MNEMKFCIFFLNDTATTEIYTLSLHDALPIFLGLIDLHRREVRDHRARLYYVVTYGGGAQFVGFGGLFDPQVPDPGADRKSTRLNSSHANISYAVFCLKKYKRRRRLDDPVILE